MEKGSRLEMSTIKTVTTIHNEVIFGRDEELGLKGATLTKEQFDVLGTVLLTHLGERIQKFALTVQLFTKSDVSFTGLDVFVLLEELATLMEEDLHPVMIDYLKVIYNALSAQAYSSRTIVNKQ
jgi:hypothetical protein